MLDVEQIYYDVTRPFRRGWHRVRWALFRNTLAVCRRCRAPAAEWVYAPSPGNEFYCDDCVPRGCSCNVIGDPRAEAVCDPPDENGRVIVWTVYPDGEPKQHMDGQGRLLPCCEYEYYRWGWVKVDNPD